MSPADAWVEAALIWVVMARAFHCTEPGVAPAPRGNPAPRVNITVLVVIVVAVVAVLVWPLVA
jgi:hypothetical protein